MLLTPRDLKYFENFKLEERTPRVNNYTTTYHDIFHLTYIKEYTNIWGNTKEKIWTKTISFVRVDILGNKPSEETKELALQLREVVSKKWKFVSQENYDFFLDTHPERFV